MPTTPTTCAEGWTPYWYACYQAVSEPNTWQGASDYCRSIVSNIYLYQGGYVLNVFVGVSIGVCH